MITFNTIPLTEYEKYMQYVTTLLSCSELPDVIKIPNEDWKDYFNIIYRAFSKESPTFVLMDKNLPEINIPVNEKDCSIAFSGGKDCTAALCYLIDKGINCSLFFAKDANKAYPNEKYTAKDVADNFNVPLTYFYLGCKGRSDQKESICKNHLIIAYIITYMIKNNHTTLCTGSYIEDSLDKTSQEYGLSDAYELFRAFEKAIKSTFKNFNHLMIFNDEYQALSYIVNNHPEVISLYRSCITSDRFFNSNKKLAQKEMDFEITKNRCGHCWKCCQEMYIFYKLGYINLTERDLQHIYKRFEYNLSHVVSDSQYKILKQKIKNNNMTIDELVSYYVTLPK